MSETRTLAILLGVLFLVGGVIPLIVGTFYDVEEVTPTGIYGNLIDVIDNGISIFSFDLDIFFFLGSDTKAYITEQISGYYLFADSVPLLANGLIVIFFIVFVYLIIKALPTT